jgi:ferrous iron transport protein A
VLLETPVPEEGFWGAFGRYYISIVNLLSPVFTAMRLSDLKLRQSAEVVSMDGNPSFGQRLMALGLLPGSRVQLVNIAPMGDPLTIEVAGRRISLRRAEAGGVEVKL